MYESRGGENDAQCSIFGDSSDTTKLFKRSRAARLRSSPHSLWSSGLRVYLPGGPSHPLSVQTQSEDARFYPKRRLPSGQLLKIGGKTVT